MLDLGGVHEREDVVVDACGLALNAPLGAAVEPHQATADRYFVSESLGEALEGNLVVRFLDGLGLDDNHAALLVRVVWHNKSLGQRLTAGSHDTG